MLYREDSYKDVFAFLFLKGLPCLFAALFCWGFIYGFVLGLLKVLLVTVVAS